ncbi:hypothetical protein M0804_011780 [Polistes exclamans]|nr:hypothetical protein M0804_011780 [Polistes exclamans]
MQQFNGQLARTYTTSGNANLKGSRVMQGLDNVSSATLRPFNSDINTPRIDSYRFSMANLEEYGIEQSSSNYFFHGTLGVIWGSMQPFQGYHELLFRFITLY